jgi:hypothetical protein
MGEEFELVGDVADVEIIAVNVGIRELKQLKSQFGGKRWRKLKGGGLGAFPQWRSAQG